MTISVRISRLRPLATVALLAACASAGAQTYAPPPAPSAPAYDSGDPANANLALVDRSPEPPPALPVYVQPPAPADGYRWVPGYWSRNRYGFFWVPGAWVLAPYSGALWTPGYWGFVNGLYVWNAGYWGPHVGFYGGINYGFGYVGIGYVGGYWNRDRFYYNRSVTNVNVTRVTNVYNHTVVVNNIDNRRVSYHGGPDGIRRNADPRELAARNDRHAPPTDMQRGFVRDAGNNRAQFY
ncbi:MAG: adenylate cyclase, partial [Achromobacter pestifer]